MNDLPREEKEGAERFSSLEKIAEECDIITFHVPLYLSLIHISLEIIEEAKHVYLFEQDEQWLEAIRATFEPWQAKVTIVQKYVSCLLYTSRCV